MLVKPFLTSLEHSSSATAVSEPATRRAGSGSQLSARSLPGPFLAMTSGEPAAGARAAGLLSSSVFPKGRLDCMPIFAPKGARGLAFGGCLIFSCIAIYINSPTHTEKSTFAQTVMPSSSGIQSSLSKPRILA